MSEGISLHILELSAGEAVRLGDLPRLMAAVLHEHPLARAAAELDLWTEIVALADAGKLHPLNALTMGPHTFPVGDGLRRSVVIPQSLKGMLEARGIQLRLVEPGNGPDYWTLSNAAAAISQTLGWSLAQSKTLTEQMLDAARGGQLVVLHPHTRLLVPLKDRENVRDFYELVGRDDVNTWLEVARAGFRWVAAESGPSEGSLLVRINGRAALPVRAIPYATGWMLSPDEVAKQFAKQMGEPFVRMRNTKAHFIDAGVSRTVLPKEWDRYVAVLNGLEAELKSKYSDDSIGYSHWRAESAKALPAGVFVWLDDFEKDHRDEATFLSPADPEREGERELTLSPMLEPALRLMIQEGFQAGSDLGSAGLPHRAEPTGTRLEDQLGNFGGSRSLSTDEVCDAFDGLGLDAIAWRTALTKDRPAWLLACRKKKGQQGAEPVQARWDPLAIAKALANGKSRKARVVAATKLDSAFRRNPLLRLSEPEWKDARADNPAWGD